MDLQTKLEQLFQQNNEVIKKITSLDELNQIRVQLLGKKGPITSVLRGMKDLSADERPKVGAFANKVRDELYCLYPLLPHGGGYGESMGSISI